MADPHIQSTIVNGLPAFAARHGLDFRRLAEKAGLPLDELENPDGMVPLNAFADMLEQGATQTGDECFGIHFAEAYPAAPQCLIGYLLVNAANVRGAVTSLARYVSLHVDGAQCDLSDEPGHAKMLWRLPSTFTAPRTQYSSFAMALLLGRLRRSAGAGWMPMRVELEHRELKPRDEVVRVLGPNVTFNNGYNALCVRDSVLARASTDADLRLFSLIEDLGKRLLAERPDMSDIVDLTKRAVLGSLERGELTLDQIATSMGLTPHMLQNRLSSADTTYEAVLSDTRRAMTDHYLRDTDLSLTEIAFLLGFSELSAFTRAAGRWFGVPPSARRVVLRRSAPQGGIASRAG